MEQRENAPASPSAGTLAAVRDESHRCHWGRQQPPPPAGAPVRSVRFAELEPLPGPPVTPAAVPVPPGGRRVPGPFQPPSGRELTPQGESSHPRASAVSSLQSPGGFRLSLCSQASAQGAGAHPASCGRGADSHPVSIQPCVKHPQGVGTSLFISSGCDTLGRRNFKGPVSIW